jgi:hypothetical protein
MNSQVNVSLLRVEKTGLQRTILDGEIAMITGGDSTRQAFGKSGDTQ